MAGALGAEATGNGPVSDLKGGLGLTIEEVQALEPFYNSEVVDVWATVFGRNLDSKTCIQTSSI